ncbi:hypothetical protein [Streptomyces sp. NPDC093544]|uniref:hypothetical protein n=1 Tax=Streptomyces sp. NPDC093544 TaxID=3155200 RepID=UPI00343D88A9
MGIAPAGGPLEAPEGASLGVPLEASGQAAGFAATEGDADPADAVDPPDEQAVTPRLRSVIPAITLSVLRVAM